MAEHDQSQAGPEAPAPEVARAPAAVESQGLPAAAAVAARGGAGNAALARFAASGNSLPPGHSSQALLQSLGSGGASNAALARFAMPAGRVIARDEPVHPPAAAPAADSTDADKAVESKATGEPPRWQMPLGSILDLCLPHEKNVEKKWDGQWKTPDYKLSVPVPIPRPLSANIGGNINGFFKANGGVKTSWERKKGSASPVGDTVSVNGDINAKGGLQGGVYAEAGIDVKLAKAMLGVHGSVKVTGDGSAKVNGRAEREGDPTKMQFGAWRGSLDLDFKFSGKVLLSGGAYFEWKILWWGDREELFQVKDWQAGSIEVSGKGKLDTKGGNDFKITKWDFTLGPKPKPQLAGTRPVGGGRQQQATRKKFDGAPAPPPPGDGDPPRLDARSAFAQIVARETSQPDAGAPPAPVPGDPARPPGDPAAQPAADGVEAEHAGRHDDEAANRSQENRAIAQRGMSAAGAEVSDVMEGEPPEEE